MHYVIPIVCRVPGEHSKGRNTHGKMFTMRNTWQTTHGIDRQAKGTFYRVYFCAHGKQISEKKPSHTFRHHCLPPPCPRPRRLELAPPEVAPPLPELAQRHLLPPRPWPLRLELEPRRSSRRLCRTSRHHEPIGSDAKYLIQTRLIKVYINGVPISTYRLTLQ